MKFIWDERKNALNIAKHGIDFSDAYRIFAGPMQVALDDREDYGEDRWTGIGLLNSRAVVIVYTEPDQTTIRVISIRKALPHERAYYEHNLENQLANCRCLGRHSH